MAAELTPKSGTWFEGTADAVRKCMHHFLNYEFDYALILSGDQLYQMDYNLMVEDHIRKNAEITLATLPVLAKEAPGFGILKTNSDGLITEFIEKPVPELLPDWTSEVSDEMKRAGKNHLASMGIYLFNRDLLVELMADPTTKDFGKEIIPQAIGNRKMLSYQYEGYWTDIGTIESFFEANLKLTDDIPDFNLFDNSRVIYTRARMLPPSKISGTTLERTIIADGCIILASRIEHSVIGIRSRIGKGTTISNSIIMGSDYYEELEEMNNKLRPMGVGERCYLNNTIVDKNCVIGNDVRINGGPHLAEADTPLYTIKEGIVILKKGAIIPDGFVI
jgi:glucose-1-phosphate adenylyltransferase